MYLSAHYVHPESQHKGYGSSLLKKGLEQFDGKYDAVFLEVDNKNKDAIQYYQNNDFEIVRSYQPEMYGEQLDLALMREVYKRYDYTVMRGRIYLTQTPYVEQKLAEEKVFKDPIHKYIHVKDQLIWDLIKTKEFQRLRRIKQLGTLYLSFHTAEHSRFGHSLGVYEIVRRMIDESFVGRDAWNNEDRPLALCATLLHDLGHGPFSHSFEKIFNTDHEAFTQAIITGPTEVNEVFKSRISTFLKKLQVINKTHQNKLVISMISSQIDADRMDYLQRDAYFTGVSYGTLIWNVFYV